MKAVFFFRRPNAPWHHSIEELFGTIIRAMPSRVQPVNYVMKRNSTGLWNRILNTIDAALHQGDVNHITGDVHYIAAFMKKSRTILTIHDLRILMSGSKLKVAVIRFFWFTFPARRVKYITVISEFSKRELIALTGISPEKIMVVYDCISPDILPVPHSFNKESPVVLQIGTTTNKNLERVVPALAGMKVTLVIIGKLTPAQERMLKEYGMSYENYFNLPYTGVLDLYKRADIVLFASTYEGFGLPVLEANAIGRVVITGNNSSLPEVAGDAALMIDVESVPAIRTAVQQLIDDEDLREKLISRGYENVKRFHPEAISAKFAEIYDELSQ